MLFVLCPYRQQDLLCLVISLGLKHGSCQISFVSITKLRKCLTKYLIECILLSMFLKDLSLLFRISVNFVVKKNLFFHCMIEICIFDVLFIQKI